jgi:maltose alpha-D-glucosyltransferase/alpha-amylase
MPAPRRRPAAAPSDPVWYKDAVLYELHVRSFADSDGDGIGDFRGATAKLDYLQDLGVTALWVLPFYPSPLRDDGYDIADYNRINPAYGTLDDFKMFLREAHRRNLRVITELVINHTSDQHPWFQRARRAKPGSVHRDFYVWSDTPDKWAETRIIFKDFETSNWTWDGEAKAYYWHRFFHHQPDLNFESPHVRKEVFKALDFWFAMGVDGMRLDAIPYLFEREGTNCENLPETHAFLKELRAHVDQKWHSRMLLAEANQWPEDTLEYFGDGDECHMAFHFPVMPRLYMALRMEDRFPVVDILQQTPDIPSTNQWAIFLRNHDELTLEMVTDEDRDYMYRVYAADPRARINLGIRRRLAPLLGNDRRRMELMNALLFSLPGTPVLYYGDEIGMGDNIYLGDRNGVRTPMQWSPDRNAGFSRANPQKLFLPVIIDPEYHYEALNVEAQAGNPHSLLWWTRRLIALRKRYQAFGRGSLEMLHPDNHRVLAFVREHDGGRILVVANLSRFVQHVELDTAGLAGAVPIELFGGTRFPRFGEARYPLTLGPHGFYWFALEAPQAAELRSGDGAEAPALAVDGGWEAAFRGEARERLATLLPGVLRSRRWFGGKARETRAVRIATALPFGEPGKAPAWLLLLDVAYTEGEAETYALPLAYAGGARARRLAKDQPGAVVARLTTRPRGGSPEEGVLYDAFADEGFATFLLAAIGGRKTFRSPEGDLAAVPAPGFAKLRGPEATLPPQVGKAEQSNTSVLYGDRLILKLFRRVEAGTNPDLELTRFLSETAAFPHTPPLAGWLELRRGGAKGEPATLAMLQQLVPNEGDAWSFSLDAFGRYLERIMTRAERTPPPADPRGLGELAAEPIPPEVRELVGLYLGSATLLGQRTAEMHLALSSAAADPTFAAEPFTTLYQQSLYQSMRTLTGRTLRLARSVLGTLGDEERALTADLLDRRQDVLDRFAPLLDRRLGASRLRIHGDYHLGQVLYTGRDFVIIDFEGEPLRALSERRIKRSPLRDVAGMIRSFDYVAYTGVAAARDRGLVPAEHVAIAEEWGRFWYRWSAAAFLAAYLERARGAAFLPADPTETRTLVDAFLLEKALYELAYELGNRPTWARIPLRGILALLAPRGAAEDAAVGA